MGFVETPGVPDDFFDSEKRLPAEDAFDFFARSDQFRRIPGTPGSNPLFDVNARDLAGGFNDFQDGIAVLAPQIEDFAFSALHEVFEGADMGID